MFKPAANANRTGYASLHIQAQDNCGTANTRDDIVQSPNTLTIIVTSVIFSRSRTHTGFITLWGSDYFSTALDFGFADPNDSPANALAAVEITTLPGAGT